MPVVEPGRILLFRANGALLGVEVRKTLKVISAENLTAAPRSPRHVKGVVLFEGKATPVFQRTEGVKPAESQGLILLLEDQHGVIGLAIDKVIGVIGDNDVALDEKGALKYNGETLEIAPPETIVSPRHAE